MGRNDKVTSDKEKGISWEMRLALARNRSMELVDAVDQGVFQLLEDEDRVESLRQSFEVVHHRIFQDSSPDHNPYRLPDTWKGDFSQIEPAFDRLAEVVYDAQGHSRILEQQTFVQMVAAFYQQIDQIQPFGDETGMPLRAFTYLLGKQFAAGEFNVDYRKLSNEDIDWLAGDEQKSLGKLEYIFQQITSDEIPVPKSLFRPQEDKAYYWEAPDIQDPRLPEDTRLLMVEKEMDGVEALCVLTCEGGYVPLGRVKEYLGDDVAALPNHRLVIPREAVVGRLEGLPDKDECLSHGGYRFLDRDILEGDEPHLVRLLNIQENIFNFQSLDGNTSLDPPPALQQARQHHMKRVITMAVAKDQEGIASPQGQPQAIYSVGTAGAGKSLVVEAAREKFGSGGFVLLERDHMRRVRSYVYNVATHPEIREVRTDYHYIHDLYSAYFDEAVEQAVRKRLHLVKDGSNPSMSQLEILHQAGYHTELHYVVVPIVVGLERNQLRYEQAEAEQPGSGRIVPPETAVTMGVRAMRTMMNYIESLQVDNIKVIDNSRKKGKHKLVAEAHEVPEGELKAKYNKGEPFLIIGKNGERLKQVGIDARKDIENMLDKKVMLKLWVKVKGGWSDDERALRSLGYEDR